MTRSELITAISPRFPRLSGEDVELAAKTILDAMTRSLGRGSRIEIRDFGSFSLNHCAPRIGRNPSVNIPELLPAIAGSATTPAGPPCAGFGNICATR